MSEPTTPWWLAWIVPMLGVFAVIGAIAKKLFTQAVRVEMSGMHLENQTRLLEMGNRLGDVETTLSRIEGRMQERWGDSRQDQR